VLDTLGMFDAALGLPEQLTAAAARAEQSTGLPPAEGVMSVIILGMGGSGIAGDVVAAVAGPVCPVPIVVAKQYECPAFVGPGTLVLAISFSGDTEETVEAAGDAAAAGARLVVICSGGELRERAPGWGAAVLPVDGSIPMPRAAIGAMAVPALVALDRLGLLDGTSTMIDAAVEQLRRRRDELGSERNVATRLARAIGRTLPIVYGGGALGDVAARRWKAQANENPKVAAFANHLPELTHNEICGWAQHGDVTRQVFSLVLLRHSFEHPQVARRFGIVAEMSEEIVSGVHSVVARGDGPLAQLLDLVLIGDLVTLHMAVAEGVDPGPVPILDDIKRQLRGA
jgi:glucose/mannose-6-phosphate isomerase